MFRSLHRCARRAESRLAQTISPSTSLQFSIHRVAITRPSVRLAPLNISTRPFSIISARFQQAEAISTTVEPDFVEEDLPSENGLPTFEQLRGKLEPVLVDTLIHDLGLKQMTEVQAKTLDAVLKGVDV
jgi:hypothetical protein